MLEIHRAAKTDPARSHAAAGLVKKGAPTFVDALKHPITPAGMQRVALRNHQPAAFTIEEGDAEMGAPDVNGQYVVHKASRSVYGMAYMVCGIWCVVGRER